MTVKYLICLALAASIAFVAKPISDAQGQQKSETSGIDKLKSPVLETRKSSAKIIQGSRAKIIRELLNVAAEAQKTDDWWSTKELAIDALGQYRAVEAVPFLVRHITYFPQGIMVNLEQINYPCAGALASVGTVAYQEIWLRFRNKMDDLEINLFVYVIRRIDGEVVGEARIAHFRKLADSISTADGEVARKNLERLLEHYKTKKKGF